MLEKLAPWPEFIYTTFGKPSCEEDQSSITLVATHYAFTSVIPDLSAIRTRSGRLTACIL
jgi:hypothetical protein